MDLSCQPHALAALPLGKRLVPISEEAGRAPEPVCIFCRRDKPPSPSNPGSFSP